MGNGTVISLGQVIVDLTMSVEKSPSRARTYSPMKRASMSGRATTRCTPYARWASTPGTPASSAPAPGRTRSAGSSRAKAYGMSVPPTKASTPDSAWR